MRVVWVAGQYSSDSTLKARWWVLRVMVMWVGLYCHKKRPVRERARKPECSPQSAANEA